MKNKYLELFRLKVEAAMSQHADKMKIFIADEKLAGSDLEGIKALREDPESTWNMEKEALNKAIKKEVAGLINRIHITAYREGIE